MDGVVRYTTTTCSSRQSSGGEIAYLFSGKRGLMVGDCCPVLTDTKPVKGEGRFDCPIKNSFFTGREGLIESISTAFSSSNGWASQHTDRGSLCPVVSLCGLGGTGKTSIALEYIWRSKELYPSGVYWLSADAMEEGISYLASYFVAQTEHSSKPKLQLQRALSKMAMFKAPWLLVVDNMDETDLSNELEEALIGSWRHIAKQGRLLITSRCRPDALAEILHARETDLGVDFISVGQFSEEDAASFLQNRLRTVPYSADEAKKLFQFLGYLPLALEQASAHIFRIKCCITDYIQKYQVHLKRQKAMKPTREMEAHRLAVHTTWVMNFDSISKDELYGDLASRFVNVSAYLAPDNIPFALINDGLCTVGEKSPTVSDDDVYPIVDLLTLLSLFKEGAGSCLSIHRMVQEVVRDRVSVDLETKMKVLSCAVRVVSKALQSHHAPKLLEGAGQSPYGSCSTWGSVALQSLHLQEHVFAVDGNQMVSFLTKDFVTVIHNSSLYASATGQQAKAKQLDISKLQILDCMSSFDKSFAMALTEVKIPLTAKLQDNVKRAAGIGMFCRERPLSFGQEEPKKPTQNPSDLVSDFETRLMSLVEQGSIRDAAEHVSHYLANHRLSNEEVARLRSRRGELYMKLREWYKAAEDARACIYIQPESHSGYSLFASVLTAMGLGRVILCDMLAAVAKHLSSRTATVKPTEYLTVSSNIELNNVLDDQKAYRRMNVVLVGRSFILNSLQLTEDINIISTEEALVRVRKSVVMQNARIGIFGIQLEAQRGLIEIRGGAVVVLYKCEVYGKGMGKPGVSVSGGSSAYINGCNITDCDGGGLLIQGPQSRAVLSSSNLSHNQQSGVEVRLEGELVAIGNEVCNNQGHGFLMSPRPGKCFIHHNDIIGNQKSGICFKQQHEADEPACEAQQTSLELSFLVDGNTILENGSHGLYVNCLNSQRFTFTVINNLLASNFFLGITVCHLKKPELLVIESNTIEGNRCGGFGFVYSLDQVWSIRDNIIQENSGPAFATIPRKSQSQIESPYSQLNVARKNEPFQSQLMNFTSNLDSFCFHCPKPCDRRKRATVCCLLCYISFYCSDGCMRRHRSRHEKVCSYIRRAYSVVVSRWLPQPEVVPNQDFIRALVSRAQRKRHQRCPSPRAGRRFHVEIVSEDNNPSCNQHLGVFDRSGYVDTWVQNSDLFHVVSECGELAGLTSKRLNVWAVLEDDSGERIRLFYHELANTSDL